MAAAAATRCAPTASAGARPRPGVNYGDSLLAEASIKLGAANTCGVQLLGNHPGLINNVLLERVQINAPTAAGADAVQIPGSSPRSIPWPGPSAST